MKLCSFRGLALAVAIGGLFGCDRKSPDDAEAQFNLGVKYADGLGVPKDAVEAVKWYRKAADQNHAHAQYNLGFMYDKGLGVPKDAAEAVKWFRKAADQNEALAQLILGIKYDEGDGVLKDVARAYMYLNLAAATNADAKRLRATLEKTMTPEQIAEGQRLTREWKPTAPAK